MLSTIGRKYLHNQNVYLAYFEKNLLLPRKEKLLIALMQRPTCRLSWTAITITWEMVIVIFDMGLLIRIAIVVVQFTVATKSVARPYASTGPICLFKVFSHQWFFMLLRKPISPCSNHYNKGNSCKQDSHVAM